MLYRKMNTSGDDLSILGLGCMRLPQKKGTPGDGPIDEKRAESQIKLAIEKGINYFDTAMPYHMGSCEPFLGKILSDDYRSRIKLATKLPPWSVNKSEDMNLIFKSQLKRLRTDHIGYYLLHALNGESWQKLKAFGVCEFLTSLKKDGMIGNAGFSFHGSRKSFEAIVDDFDWDFCQIQYNYLDVQNQAGRKGLKYAASKGLGVIIMEPLRGGLLARKPPSEIDAIWDEAQDKKTPVEWALRWIWNHPEVTVVLSGMNEESQIEDNIRYAQDAEPNSLLTEDLELIKRVSDQFYKMMKVGCTGCHYCMPCPSGVNIPTCFEYYNHMHMYKDVNWAKLSYLARVGGLFSDPSKASLCEKCGECEEKCPQKLPVQDFLEMVSSEMEGPFFNAKVWAFQKFIRFKNGQAIRSISK